MAGESVAEDVVLAAALGTRCSRQKRYLRKFGDFRAAAAR